MTQGLFPVVLWTVILVELVYLYAKQSTDGLNPKFRNRRSINQDEEGKHLVGETYDYSGEYRIIRFYRSDGLEPNWSWNDLTLATQGSLNRLSYLKELVARFQGPISISIFAPGFDAAFADVAIQRLKSCSADISKFVTFHLVYPADFPADIAYETGWEEISCEEFEKELKNFDISLGPSDLVYPHNVLRNVARSGVFTEFVFLIDIDLVPNHSLRSDFLKLANAENLWDIENDQRIFVVPAFEIKNGHALPESKSELISGVEKKFIRPFHNETCYNCHKSEDYKKWKSLTSKEGLKISFEGNWNPNWEPFYIGRRSVPMYDERFKGQGFDRIQQICELYVAGFTMLLLDNAFVIHDGFKYLNEVENDDEAFNWYLFNYHFKDELQRKYQTTKTCSPLDHASDEFLNYPVVQGPREGQILMDRPVNDDFNRYQIQQNQMGIPVAISNEQPFAMEVIDPSSLETVKPHDHRKLVVVSKERHIKHYSREELEELYQKSLTEESQMPEFKEKNKDDLSWE